MDDRPREEMTRALRELGDGRRQSAGELLPLVYEELRSLARARMRLPLRADDRL